jgi:hypothetical protein
MRVASRLTPSLSVWRSPHAEMLKNRGGISRLTEARLTKPFEMVVGTTNETVNSLTAPEVSGLKYASAWRLVDSVRLPAARGLDWLMSFRELSSVEIRKLPKADGLVRGFLTPVIFMATFEPDAYDCNALNTIPEASDRWNAKAVGADPVTTGACRE